MKGGARRVEGGTVSLSAVDCGIPRHLFVADGARLQPDTKKSVKRPVREAHPTCRTGLFGAPFYARDTYSPERVSITILSPTLIKNGTWSV